MEAGFGGQAKYGKAMEEKILDIFRAQSDRYISGSELGRTLGTSRSAVWKHMEKLRQMGYQIIAQPHLGYRLVGVPDRLLPDEIGWKLKTKIIGRRILSYETTDSTNDIAEHLGLGGAQEGTVVFAESQTRGRGRWGRKWLSPRGKSVLFSIILRPEINTEESPQYTLMAAVGVSRAIRKVTGCACLIKWPNDLVINGRKVGGVLTELNAEVNRIKFLVVGIGINVNVKPEELPKNATSIMIELKNKISRITLVQELLRQLDEQYQLLQEGGFITVIREWKNLSATLGQRVKISTGNGQIEGQAIGVDKNGALLLREDSGFQRRILSGDVLLVRSP